MAKSTRLIWVLPLFLTACVGMPSHEQLHQEAQQLSHQAKGLKPEVAKRALTAYYRAQSKGIGRPAKFAIVDYSKPSTEPRLWVFDMQSRKVVFQELVAHGKNSGQGKHATVFSDEDNSLKSSLGLYMTMPNAYGGRHGYSLRLKGLEPGFNGNAMRRAIVVHGAGYVSEAFARSNGRLGLSWGCPAISKETHRQVIDELKGGNLIFAYYPDNHWLTHSQFLNG